MLTYLRSQLLSLYYIYVNLNPTASDIWQAMGGFALHGHSPALNRGLMEELLTCTRRLLGLSLCTDSSHFSCLEL